jgi:uncharacterized protein (TIGR02996 family)
LAARPRSRSGHRLSHDDPRVDSIERALREHPDDDETWLVYADHFIQRGHPRGPLIAIESAPVKNMVQRAEREAETRRMRLAANDVFAGPLAGRSGLVLRWRRGFIYEAILRGGFRVGEASDLLFDLLRHPSGRFVRELVVPNEDLLFDLLLAADPAPPLRKLVVERSNSAVCTLGTLGAIYPLLEDVRLAGDCYDLAGLSLPRVQRLELHIERLPRDTLRAVATAAWPALEHFTLALGHSDCTLDDLAFIFALPRIHTLRFDSPAFPNELAEALVHSRLAAQLRRIELRSCTLDDATYDLLAPYDPDLF